MRVYDLIAKKRDGGTHSREELEQIVNGYVSGEVTDYQMAAWMMAVYLRGMTDEETAELTDVMAHSGVMVDLSPIPGIKVDKHSTGGVGDKTTLVITPINDVATQMDMLGNVEETGYCSQDSSMCWYFENSELKTKVKGTFSIDKVLRTKIENILLKMISFWQQYFFRDLMESGKLRNFGVPVPDVPDSNSQRDSQQDTKQETPQDDTDDEPAEDSAEDDTEE